MMQVAVIAEFAVALQPPGSASIFNGQLMGMQPTSRTGKNQSYKAHHQTTHILSENRSGATARGYGMFPRISKQLRP